MVNIIETSYSVSTFLQLPVTFLDPSSLRFSKTMSQLIELRNQWICCLAVLPISSDYRCGHQAAQTWTPLTTNFGVCCSNASTRAGFTTWNSWKTVSLKSGVVSHRTSLTKPSRNSVFDWGRVFVKTVAILSTNCRPDCGSYVFYERRPYWNVAVLFFKRLYIINSKRNFVETCKFYAI